MKNLFVAAEFAISINDDQDIDEVLGNMEAVGDPGRFSILGYQVEEDGKLIETRSYVSREYFNVFYSALADKDFYVVVDTVDPLVWNEDFYRVEPYEDPHTYPSYDEAAETLVEYEEGTRTIFRLIEV